MLTPWLSSLWLGLVTPVYARVGRKLIDSLRNETVVTSSRAAELFPAIRPRGMREALERARVNEGWRVRRDALDGRALVPIHTLIFAGMLRGIAKAANR